MHNTAEKAHFKKYPAGGSTPGLQVHSRSLAQTVEKKLNTEVYSDSNCSTDTFATEIPFEVLLPPQSPRISHDHQWSRDVEPLVQQTGAKEMEVFIGRQDKQ